MDVSLKNFSYLVNKFVLLQTKFECSNNFLILADFSSFSQKIKTDE